MVLFEDIVHKALASEMRRSILLSLTKGEKYLTEISNEIGKKPQTINFHLSLLEEIGLVGSEVKKGKKYYFLKDKRIVDHIRKHRPIPNDLRPKPPHEIVIDMWEDMKQRLDRIEKKIDKLSK